MQGKLCLITGGTSGIGKATAIALARMGATIVLAARNEDRGRQACEAVTGASGSTEVRSMVCDLASQSSIRVFAKQFLETFDRLDVLVHSGGAVFPDRKLTEDGIERNFAVAYLSVFLLATLLSERLVKSAPSRVVIVTGEYHRNTSMDFDNLMGEKRFSMMEAGSQAALAKVLFASELSRRIAPKGVDVNSLHPGAVRTSLLRNLPWHVRALAYPVQLFFASPEKGARTPVYLASSPQMEGVTGKYFIGSSPVRASKEAQDRAVASRLWAVCEQLVAPSV